MQLFQCRHPLHTGSLHRRINAMHIFVIVQRIQKISHLFARGFIERGKVFRQVTDFRRDDIPTRRFQALLIPSPGLEFRSGLDDCTFGDRALKRSAILGLPFGIERWTWLQLSRVKERCGSNLQALHESVIERQGAFMPRLIATRT